MKTREPDWDELKRIGERAETAKSTGTLGYALWSRMHREAAIASKGQGFAEFLCVYCQEGWYDRLIAEEETHRAAKKKSKRLTPAA
jgi:hypothetical protein